MGTVVGLDFGAAAEMLKLTGQWNVEVLMGLKVIERDLIHRDAERAREHTASRSFHAAADELLERD